MTKSDIEIRELDDLVNLFQRLTLIQGCELIIGAFSTWAVKVVNPSSDEIAAEVVTYTLSGLPKHLHPAILNEWSARKFREHLVSLFSGRMAGMTILIPEGERPIRWKTNRQALDPNELSRRSHMIAARMSGLPIPEAFGLAEEIVKGWALRHDLDELRWHVANYAYRDPTMADQLGEDWTEARISEYIPFLLANMTEH